MRSKKSEEQYCETKSRQRKMFLLCGAMYALAMADSKMSKLGRDVS